MPFFWLLYVSLIIGMVWQILDLPSPPGKAPEILQILSSQGRGGKVYRVVTDYFDGD